MVAEAEASCFIYKVPADKAVGCRRIDEFRSLVNQFAYPHFVPLVPLFGAFLSNHSSIIKLFTMIKILALPSWIVLLFLAFLSM